MKCLITSSLFLFFCVNVFAVDLNTKAIDTEQSVAILNNELRQLRSNKTSKNDASLVPIGAILPYGGTTAPNKYLLCDGSAYSQSRYPKLYAVIGTNFGYTTSIDFKVPSMARRVLVGTGGSGTATLGNTVGSAGGEESVTLDSTQMPAHIHTPITNTAGAHNYIIAVDGGTGYTVPTFTPSTGDVSYAASAGGGLAHNNLPPSLVVSYIIYAGE